MLLLGIEVKAGQSIKTDPGANYVIHLSQVRSDLRVEVNIIIYGFFFIV